MKVLYERVAGIDVHKDMVKVAVRSPGDKPWTRTTEILEFRTFYGVLQEMARELRRRGVTHVVMEASGVYTEPVYYALCEQDFAEVAVINPAHAKALKGHKTDAKDCARLAELFECGLLRGSYIPPAELKEVRDLTRYRMKTVQARTSEIQRLGKALESAGFPELRNDHGILGAAGRCRGVCRAAVSPGLFAGGQGGGDCDWAACYLGESGQAQVHGGVAAGGQRVQLGEFGCGRGEADLESFDFAEPSLFAGFGHAGLQVIADAGQPGTLGGVGA
jgi:hypothetical protein